MSSSSSSSITPQANDVLWGRGKESFNHPGNSTFRDLVKQHRAPYQATNLRSKKSIFITNILETIKGAGGRFLKEVGDSWAETSEDEAYTKVSHALRSSRGAGLPPKPKKPYLRRFHSAPQPMETPSSPDVARRRSTLQKADLDKFLADLEQQEHKQDAARLSTLRRSTLARRRSTINGSELQRFLAEFVEDEEEDKKPSPPTRRSVTRQSSARRRSTVNSVELSRFLNETGIALEDSARRRSTVNSTDLQKFLAESGIALDDSLMQEDIIELDEFAVV